MACALAREHHECAHILAVVRRALLVVPRRQVYIMSLEMDGAGACSGMLAPDDRIIEVDGVPATSLPQVTNAFRESRDIVKVKVASRVVYGGWLNKKGEVNTTLQLRWFLLSDEGNGSVLRYYEGRNVRTRLCAAFYAPSALPRSTPHCVSATASPDVSLDVQPPNACSHLWTCAGDRW